jgi:arabinose-5-phosphate isomerase
MGILNDHNISALLVVNEAFQPVGVVHFHDLLRIGVA